MELVEVEILTQTITAQYGVLSQGDILRTSAAFARHLVKDAFAAKYAHAKDEVEPEPEREPETGAPTGKPSDGLKVEELKAALAAKSIDIPEGVTLKADLAALLDGAA